MPPKAAAAPAVRARRCADGAGTRARSTPASPRGQARGCQVKIFALEDLAVSRCGCSGYQRATAPLAQAAFATEDVPVVDTAIPELRVIDPP